MKNQTTQLPPCPNIPRESIRILKKQSPSDSSAYKSPSNPFWFADFLDELYLELMWRNEWAKIGSPRMPDDEVSSTATRDEVVQALWADEKTVDVKVVVASWSAIMRRSPSLLWLSAGQG